MNPIQLLEQKVRDRFPEAQLQMGAPAMPEGRWFLDISVGDYSLVVEWEPEKGFGISTPRWDSLGERPDEVFPDVDAAWESVRGHVLALKETQPPEAALPDLRMLLGMSQVELADRLGVQQAAISRLEHRPDMLVSTLANVVSALGGVLEIRARFPRGAVRLSKLGKSGPPS